MHGGRHEHALARPRGRLENGVGERGPLVGVVEQVLAPPRHDAQLAGAHQIVQLVGMHARRIHHGPAGKAGARRRRHEVARTLAAPAASVLPQPPDAHHPLAEAQAGTVLGRLLQAGERDLVRIADSAGAGQQRAPHGRGDGRLQRAHRGGVQLAHALHAVVRRPRHERADARQLLVGERQHERAVAPVGEAQLVGPLREEPRALPVVARLERAGHRIVAGMHDAGVRAGRPAGHVVAGLEHGYVKTVAGQLARTGCAGHARSYHDDVIGRFFKGIHVVQLTIFPRWAKGRTRNRANTLS